MRQLHARVFCESSIAHSAARFITLSHSHITSRFIARFTASAAMATGAWGRGSAGPQGQVQAPSAPPPMSARDLVTGVVWFKSSDLRILDHAPLVAAHAECASVHHVFVFDPRHFRATNRVSLKSSRRRFQFLVDSINDVASSLHVRCVGRAPLHVLVGRPEEALHDFALRNNVTTVYCHEEVTHEEITVLAAVRSALSKIETKKTIVDANGRSGPSALTGPSKREVGGGVRLRSDYWGGTLLEPQQLPFAVADLPFFTAFRKKVEETDLIKRLSESKSPAFTPCQSAVSYSGNPHAPPSRGVLLEGIEAAPTTSARSPDAPPLIDADALWSRLLTLAKTEREQQSGIGGCAVERRGFQCDAGIASSTVSVHPVAVGPTEDEALQSTVSDARSAFPLAGGETAAWERIRHYIGQGEGRLSVYKETRNGMIGLDYSSKLSPYLALGCVSARSVLRAIRQFEVSSGIANESTYWLVFELMWRDYMRFYAHKIGRKLFLLGGAQGRKGREKYPWGADADKLRAWKEGRTGYPFVDANMRELLATGFMSNRGRQNVASFLVRDLGLDWRYGAEHFETHLVDHDPCSNYGNWQYAAGVGADPREDRYFNIVKQAGDYDSNGDYIRTWCPELCRLPTKYLLDIRLLTSTMRAECGISAEVYPLPIIALRGNTNSAGGGHSNNFNNKHNSGNYSNNRKKAEQTGRIR